MPISDSVYIGVSGELRCIKLMFMQIFNSKVMSGTRASVSTSARKASGGLSCKCTT